MTSSIADLIGPQLPYLRRFARALSGTQEQGDAYVLATLEAIVADNMIFDHSLEPRVALYKSFLRVWNSMPLNSETQPVEVDKLSVADRRIDTITPLPRQAFLLAVVEEFSSSQIASILQTDVKEAVQLVSKASREIAEQISARVLIIEDEPLIALDIETLVSEAGHEVVGLAATHSEAIDEARRAKPELVLADIQLADGSSGIAAVNDILDEINVPVIFVTAYPERLLTGERPEPAFLIAKPFRSEMLKAVISQALFFDVKAGRQATGAAA